MAQAYCVKGKHMVEIHPAPDQALSDGFQQLDLDAFATLVHDLGLDRGPVSEREADALTQREGVA